MKKDKKDKKKKKKRTKEEPEAPKTLIPPSSAAFAKQQSVPATSNIGDLMSFDSKPAQKAADDLFFEPFQDGASASMINFDSQS